MTDKTPENTISPDEISEAFAQSFAPTIGYLTFENLRLKKLVQALQGHAAEAEAALVNIKQENSNLIANHIQFEARIFELEKELEARPALERVADLEAQVEQLIKAGPTIEQISTLEAAKVAEARKEKAALVGAA